jgi:hypothetical protein
LDSFGVRALLAVSTVVAAARGDNQASLSVLSLSVPLWLLADVIAARDCGDHLDPSPSVFVRG